MLQQPHRLLIHELRDHIREHGAYSVETFVRLTDVLEAHVVEKDFLDDEDRDRLAEFRPGLHNTETERDDLGGQEEVNDFGAVVLD